MNSKPFWPYFDQLLRITTRMHLIRLEPMMHYNDGIMNVTKFSQNQNILSLVDCH